MLDFHPTFCMMNGQRLIVIQRTGTLCLKISRKDSVKKGSQSPGNPTMSQLCSTGLWTLEKTSKWRRKRRSSNPHISGSADTKCKCSFLKGQCQGVTLLQHHCLGHPRPIPNTDLLPFRFLELKLRTSGCQGLYLTISTRDFRHSSKGFVKLAYSLTSNFPKATRVINEADVFDREGSGWGYEEFFPLSWAEFKDQLKRTPLIITSQVSLLE